MEQKTTQQRHTQWVDPMPKLILTRPTEECRVTTDGHDYYRCAQPGCGSTWPVHDAKAYDIIYGRWWCQSHVPEADA